MPATKCRPLPGLDRGVRVGCSGGCDGGLQTRSAGGRRLLPVRAPAPGPSAISAPGRQYGRPAARHRVRVTWRVLPGRGTGGSGAGAGLTGRARPGRGQASCLAGAAAAPPRTARAAPCPPPGCCKARRWHSSVLQRAGRQAKLGADGLRLGRGAAARADRVGKGAGHERARQMRADGRGPGHDVVRAGRVIAALAMTSSRLAGSSRQSAVAQIFRPGVM